VNSRGVVWRCQCTEPWKRNVLPKLGYHQWWCGLPEEPTHDAEYRAKYERWKTGLDDWP
jgi:hypothetical protein